MKNFKRFFFGIAFILGLMLTFVFSAFKVISHNNKVDDLYTFRYEPAATDPNPAYSIASVQDINNWSYAPGESCPNGSAKACTIEASHVDASSAGDPVLLQSENIVADDNNTGVAFVTSTADGSGSSFITNKAN